MKKFDKILSITGLVLSLFSGLGCVIYWGIQLYDTISYKIKSYMDLEREKARQKGYDQGWENCADRYRLWD